MDWIIGQIHLWAYFSVAAVFLVIGAIVGAIIFYPIGYSVAEKKYGGDS